MLTVRDGDITRFASKALCRASRLALCPQHNKSRGQSTTYYNNPPRMNSPVVSPVPRPAEFQAHIYDSFLQGRTSDVALRICGSWDAFYKFHRVVLIQAVRTLSLLLLWSSVRLHPLEEFFRDLFTGGFVESEDKGFSPGSRVASGPIELTLYDPNITRAGTWLPFLFYTVHTNRPTIPVLTWISAFEYVLIGSYRPYFNHPLSFIWTM